MRDMRDQKRTGRQQNQGDVACTGDSGGGCVQQRLHGVGAGGGAVGGGGIPPLPRPQRQHRRSPRRPASLRDHHCGEAPGTDFVAAHCGRCGSVQQHAERWGVPASAMLPGMLSEQHSHPATGSVTVAIHDSSITLPTNTAVL